MAATTAACAAVTPIDKPMIVIVTAVLAAMVELRVMVSAVDGV